MIQKRKLVTGYINSITRQYFLEFCCKRWQFLNWSMVLAVLITTSKYSRVSITQTYRECTQFRYAKLWIIGQIGVQMKILTIMLKKWLTTAVKFQVASGFSTIHALNIFYLKTPYKKRKFWFSIVRKLLLLFLCLLSKQYFQCPIFFLSVHEANYLFLATIGRLQKSVVLNGFSIKKEPFILNRPYIRRKERLSICVGFHLCRNSSRESID